MRRSITFYQREKNLSELIVSDTHQSNEAEVEVISASSPQDSSDKYSGRFNTKKEISIFNDSGLIHFLRKEPANKLILFEREVIRDGCKLLMLKESTGVKSYVHYIKSDVIICDQCQVGSKPMDFLLILHEDYDKHVFPPKLKQEIFS